MLIFPAERFALVILFMNGYCLFITKFLNDASMGHEKLFFQPEPL